MDVDTDMTLHGFAVEVVSETGSTSEDLKQRAVAGAPGGIALLARRQTAGRGRLGRQWQSAEGNLHLSLLLRPAMQRHPGHWSLLAAVALLDALRTCLPGEAKLRVKWPNDVLLGGAKLAGILLERGAEGGLEDRPWLVIGFGVNLASSPDGLDRSTTCIADLAPPPAPDVFAHLLLDAIHKWRNTYEADGFQTVRAAWLAAGPTPGEAMLAAVGQRGIEGAFHGIDVDGSLLLDGPRGVVTVTSGEVEMLSI
jgi:BirA family biotin operon repressor/biotin-[acetyl-CoA-carboxylase] ligase